MTTRRESRIVALQILYGLEINRGEPASAAADCAENLLASGAGVPLELSEFTMQIVEGVAGRLVEIDEMISTSSKNWKLSRMAMVDRNILRLAVYELLAFDDIPKRVTINEAIELGKKFGSQDSGSFINGVLDKISQDVLKE